VYGTKNSGGEMFIQRDIIMIIISKYCIIRIGGIQKCLPEPIRSMLGNNFLITNKKKIPYSEEFQPFTAFSWGLQSFYSKESISLPKSMQFILNKKCTKNKYLGILFLLYRQISI
jgi:hypothetical protein